MSTGTHLVDTLYSVIIYTLIREQEVLRLKNFLQFMPILSVLNIDFQIMI